MSHDPFPFRRFCEAVCATETASDETVERMFDELDEADREKKIVTFELIARFRPALFARMKIKSSQRKISIDVY